jgi:uroporphyrin-III C-methyltransferase/precorrin-2 dehydrogenase/sirohydrochlorin ferrochelatase
VTGHSRDGELPADLDWRSIVDPAATTAIYMPKRTFAALAAKAIAEGLDPQTPAIAIARATCPDQIVLSGTVDELPARRDVANVVGPVIVIIGHVCHQICRDLGNEKPSLAAAVE